MKNIAFNVILLFIYTTLTCCQDNLPVSNKSPTEIRTDNAIFLIYKIYSSCTTTIVEKHNNQVDTLVKNIEYLCLPVKVNAIEVNTDTTIITIFFEPERGYELEDTKCNGAYSIGFIGSDNECDFIEFGDNYYTLTVSQYMKENIHIDSIFNAKISNLDCINLRLINIIKNK